MKKINSIGFGPPMVKLGLIFLLPVPAFFYILSLVFPEAGFVRAFIKLSAAIGTLFLLAMSTILLIELYQDKKINSNYLKNKKIKIKISEGVYECQTCGCQRVAGDQKTCPSCGVRFIESGSR